jgi:serine protease Do
MALIIATIVAALACGAAPAKGKGKVKVKAKTSAPLSPTTYDPRVSLAPLVEKVSPAVVNIRTKAKPRIHRGMSPFGNDLFDWFFGPQAPQRRPAPTPSPQPRSLGSGFIIDAKGLVVTNNHVVDGANEIEVQLSDERKFKAELVGSDDRTDVALLRLKNASKLPIVKFGDSDRLKVGDHVVAIGNPFGLDHTVTSGIVSAKERVIGAGPYDDFIQTDASINPGNSGGPLFNLKGEVIGINTAINPMGQGIGFAIPSSLASGVIEALGSGGEVVRGWLGISFQPLTEDLVKAFKLKETEGAVVANVTPGSPAEKGGMKAGDVIVAVQGKKVGEARDLPHMVAKLKPGATARIKVIRRGSPQNLKIKIGKMPQDPSKAKAPEKKSTKLGFSVRELDDRTRQQLDAEKLEGVVVDGLEPGAAAAELLQNGDIILEVNRTPIRNLKEFNEQTKGLNAGDDLVLRIYRGGSWLWLAFRL